MALSIFDHLGNGALEPGTSAATGLGSELAIRTKPSDNAVDVELLDYLRLLEQGETQSGGPSDGGSKEELRTTPIFSWPVKLAYPQIFAQYGLISSRRGSQTDPAGPCQPLFMNTNAPSSAFICGSQGSGKSHTLSCILENSLYRSSTIGKLPSPLAGMLFHYDAHGSGNICEAATLCSHIPVTVLCSPSNIWRMRDLYSNVKGAYKIKVLPLLLKERHLNTQRMLHLMSFSDKDSPLYMEVIIKILKEMAQEAKGLPGLRYSSFLLKLDDAGLSRDQNGPLKLRLSLLGSFLETKFKNNVDIFANTPGALTIVDLTDPFVDAASACSLFETCLALFLEKPPACGRIIALDEAHKFMNQTSAAENFTESLLTVIREQRHKAARIIIATQEPTISPKLLDLCSVTFVHRFTSPEWMTALQGHLAGASTVGGGSKSELQDLFKEIVNLNVGEHLLFSPSATLDAVGGTAAKLGMACVKCKTRPRITADGGRSIMAIETAFKELL